MLKLWDYNSLTWSSRESILDAHNMRWTLVGPGISAPSPSLWSPVPVYSFLSGFAPISASHCGSWTLFDLGNFVVMYNIFLLLIIQWKIYLPTFPWSSSIWFSFLQKNCNWLQLSDLKSTHRFLQFCAATLFLPLRLLK